jgi:hypothetical protein
MDLGSVAGKGGVTEVSNCTGFWRAYEAKNCPSGECFAWEGLAGFFLGVGVISVAPLNPCMGLQPGPQRHSLHW